jgi:hypothetical protein
MRILIKIVQGFLGLILLSILGLLALPWVPVVQDQFGTKDYDTWLSENRSALDQDSLPSFSLDEDDYQARFIMLSEIHGYKDVQDIDFALLQHLIAQGQNRYYLAELGADQAMAFNNYLETGDDAPLRSVFDRWADQSAQWANQEFFEKLERIRVLNSGLSDNHRVWFVGVDRMSDPQSFRELVSDLYPQGGTQDSAYNIVQSLNVMMAEASVSRDEDASRYDHILANIDLLVSQVEDGRHFYGLWGLFHGSKAPVNGARPLAQRLNETGGAFENSVVSVSTLCVEGCLNMMPARALPSFAHGPNNEPYVYIPMSFDNPYLQRARGVSDIIRAMGDDDIVVFQISGEGSPYEYGDRLTALSGYLTLMQKFEYGAPAAEVSDYMIAMKGSAGLTPWRGEAHDLMNSLPD